MMKTIETRRLILRPFRKGDAEAMYRNWTSDPRVAEHCRWYAHESVSTTQDLLSYYISDDSPRWAITLRGDDEPIGCIDVVGVDERGVPEVGYVLSHAYWGQGIMTETLRAVIGVLLEDGAPAVSACHSVRNPASGRVMEKCGMVYRENRMGLEKFGSDRLCEVKVYETPCTRAEK